MSKIIGIDLGTTNSCVAVMEGGDPIVIGDAGYLGVRVEDLTAGAARFRHAEQDGRAPQQDQHSGDEDRPAGQHVPGHREQHPGQQEREPRAGAHDAGEPD